MSEGKNAAAEEEGEEDDYMSMTFGEPEKPKFETSVQRAARLKKEREAKGYIKPKAEIEKERQAALEKDLATPFDSSNKGFKMMEKLGFKGGGLGSKERAGEARTEPIHLARREDRGGIGLLEEKKRKFREEAAAAEADAEHLEKKKKADEGEYVERVIRERKEKRLEGQIIGAMKVAERLDEDEDEHRIEADKGVLGASQDAALPKKPLRSINVLWRSSVRHRLEKERQRRMRHDLHQSLSRLPTYNDADEDEQDKQAFGRVEEELDEDDTELDKFLALDPEVKLQKLTEHLRKWHNYCFWCKTRYPDDEMEGCPGLTEEDHD